jgi:hypothetical protein
VCDWAAACQAKLSIEGQLRAQELLQEEASSIVVKVN